MSGNNTNTESIFIRSSAATNGMTTLLIGAVVAITGTSLIVFLPELFFLVGILFLSGSIIAFVMGFYKLREPQYSIEITREAINYNHRKGTWRIEWDNIQRIDVPRIHKGLQHIDLEMIGIRLKQPENVLNTISPRLITHILMEQRPLVAHLAMSNCESGHCYGNDIIEDTKFKCSNGKLITGVSAMFANRMAKLQRGLGYDIYISVNEVDRDAPSFVNLLRDCHESVIQSVKEKESSVN